ncbi:isochorismatase family cysteine hydrolase [Patulibacter defluvii]|uniref:isochorismatase family cysteine hydrolase n=1 Tax=Patulibacter defluvii TaxID=3095358 RepID=UPI002A75B6F0|nr:isochorismatase family cysteine hydrolase [Patulibacter sp. DM4]
MHGRPDDDRERTALLVVDMIKTYDHDDGDALRHAVRRALPAIGELLDLVWAARSTVIYVNDAAGDPAADRHALLARALAGRDAALVEPIRPPDAVPFVFKTRHSAFFHTTLEPLLAERGIGRLIVCGQVTEQCILYSAIDAYERGYSLSVPEDAVAGIDDGLAAAALRMMAENLGAEVAPAAALRVATESPGAARR